MCSHSRGIGFAFSRWMCRRISLSLSLSEQAIIFFTCSCVRVYIVVFVDSFSDWSVCVQFDVLVYV